MKLEKKWIIRELKDVSDDSAPEEMLVAIYAKPYDHTGYKYFNSEEEAVNYCESNGLFNVLILPFYEKR